MTNSARRYSNSPRPGRISALKARVRASLCAALLAALLGVSLSPAANLKAAPENRPYDASLLRLSEILGAVHYLRALCGIDDNQAWRVKMEQLIAAEGQTVKRKLKLTKSFNKGYRSFQRTYRHCTPSAKTAIDHFLDEGIEIAEKLVANR